MKAKVGILIGVSSREEARRLILKSELGIYDRNLGNEPFKIQGQQVKLLEEVEVTRIH